MAEGAPYANALEHPEFQKLCTEHLMAISKLEARQAAERIRLAIRLKREQQVESSLYDND